jgi:hypothetical protein
MFARFDLLALSRRRSAKFVLAFFVAVVAITPVAFTARARRDKKGSASKHDAVAAQPSPALNAIGYVRRARLWPQLRYASEVLGDRLEKPGKERIIMTGAVTRPNIETDRVPVRLIAELPDKVRLEELNGHKAGITIFDGADLKSSRRALDKSDYNEIESLVFDATDHFFIGQMQGVATRFLGSHFRLDNGQSTNYNGPFYDIYQIWETIALKKDAARLQLKHYYFNSQSQLLERIKYSLTEPNGKPIQIEIQLGGWKQFGGQYLPTSLQRLEDDSPVFILTIEGVVLGQRLADGIFANF